MPLPMLLPLLLSLAAADDVPAADDAVPASTEQRRVLVLPTAGDLEASRLSSVTRLVVDRLGRFEQLDVIARKDAEQRLTAADRDAVAGCDGGPECVAALAAAFDADVVATATAGKVAGSTVFTLELVDATGAPLQRETAQVSGLDDVTARITRVIDDVGRALTGAEPGTSSASSSSSSSSSSPSPSSSSAEVPALRLPLLVGGGVVVGLGAVVGLLGLLPAFAASGAESELKVLRADYVAADRDDDILATAADRQRDADEARDQWNNAGIYAFWGGFVVVAAGAGALAAGFFAQDAP